MNRRFALHCLFPGLAAPLAVALFIALLGACTAVSPAAPTTAPAAQTQPIPPPLLSLVITGTDAAGSPARLELPAAAGFVALHPSDEYKAGIISATTATPYVEYILVKDLGGNTWRLFYAQKPPGLAAAAAAQASLNPAAVTATLTATASLVYSITDMQPLSPTAGSAPISLSDAIVGIRTFNDELDEQNNQLVGRLTPFMLMTDGAADPARTLVIFGGVSPDGTGDEPGTGVCDTVRRVCEETHNGVWYCHNIIVEIACAP